MLIEAADVSLAPGDPGPLSIRSALAGRIAAIVPDGPLAAVTVALDGGEALVALVTRRALHDLGLREGVPVRRARQDGRARRGRGGVGGLAARRRCHI